MNKIFKVIFNRGTGQLTVVSEMARGNTKSIQSAQSKSSSRIKLKTPVTLVAMLSGTFFAGQALAANLVSGETNVGTTSPACEWDKAGARLACAGGTVGDRSNNSVAIGSSAAVGSNSNYAFALGNNATTGANTNSTIAIGQGATVSEGATNGFAMGRNASSLGANAIAIGPDVQAKNNGVAIGNAAKAVGESNSVAIGQTAKAEGVHGIAIGTDSKGKGARAIAVGHNAQSEGDFGTAIGYSAKAKGVNSVAIGRGAKADGQNTLALGQNAGFTLTAAPTTDGTPVDVLSVGAKTGKTVVYNAVTNTIPHLTEVRATSSSGSINVTSIGNSAGSSTINNNYGVNIGFNAGKNYNSYYGEGVAIGRDAGSVTNQVLQKNGTGSEVNFITGNTNTAISSKAGENTAGHNNVAMGYHAGGYNFGSNNLAIGYQAGRMVSNNSGTELSEYAITYNTDGYAVLRDFTDTVALGSKATVEANNTIAIGKEAVAKQANAIAQGTGAKALGASSIAIGENADNPTNSGAGPYNEPGKYNVIIAKSTDEQKNNINSIAIGKRTMSYGNNNIVMGEEAQAGYGINYSKSFAHNIAIGSSAEATNEKGIAIGYDSYIGTDAPSAIALGDTARVGRYSSESIAIGKDAYAKHRKNIAMGASASSDGIRSTSIGSNSLTVGRDATAVGSLTKVYDDSQNSTAVGYSSTVYGKNSIALGSNAKVGISVEKASTPAGNVIDKTKSTYADYAVSIGSNSSATAEKTIAIGKDAYGSEIGAIAIGDKGRGTAHNAIAIGASAQAQSVASTAIGASAIAVGESTVALGHSVQTTAHEAIAIGAGSGVAGRGSAAIGLLNLVQGSSTYVIGSHNGAHRAGSDGAFGIRANQASVLGNYNEMNGNNSHIVGNRNIVDQENTVVLGNSVTTTQSNSVVLGNESTDRQGQAINTATVGNLTYSGFAGVGSAENGVVSIGKAGGERQLINVAAGEISDTSTDAINGSQLYVTNTVLGNVADTVVANFGGNAALDPNKVGNITFTDIGGTGKNTIDEAIKASKTEVLAGTNVSSVEKREGVDGQSIYTVNANGTTVSGTGAVNVIAGEKDANNVINYALDLTQATKDDIAKGVAADTAIRSQGLTFTADKNTTTTIKKLGDTLAVNGDTNITTKATSDAISVTLNPTLTDITSIAITDGPTINGEGLDMNGKPITNLAAGSAPTDAVNKAQLDNEVANINTSIAANKTHFYSVNGLSTSANYNNDGATGENAIAAGVAASATAREGIALGTNSSATGDQTVAIGESAGQTYPAITGITAPSIQGTFVGPYAGIYSQGISNTALGYKAGGGVNGVGNLSLGVNAGASDPTKEKNNTISIGNTAIASKDNAIAIGTTATAQGESSVALGNNASIIANGTSPEPIKSIVIGNVSNTQSSESIVLGNNSAIAYGADNNIVVGNRNYVEVGAENNAILGHNIIAQYSNHVILGNGSTDRVATTETEANVNGLKYKGFAGQGSVEKGVVSFGKEGGERQLINVAAGQIAKNSTDAINGSQLWLTQQKLGNVSKSVKENFGGNANIDPDTGDITFTNIGGTGKDNINDAIEAVRAGVETVNAATFGLSDDNGKSVTNNLNQTIKVVGDDNIVTDASSGNQLEIKLKKDLMLDSVTMGDTKIDNNGLAITGGPSISKKGINAGGNKITNVVAGTNDSDAVNVKQLNELRTSVANSGWKLNTDGVNNGDIAPEKASFVKHNSTVNFVSKDKSIKITHQKAGDDVNVDLSLGNDVNIGGPSKDGKDGADGKLAVNGKDGKTGVALNGKDGSIGMKGQDGANATLTVAKGADGVDGKNGANGKDRLKVNGEDVATLNDGVKYEGDQGKAAVKLNQTTKVVGGAKGELTDGNIGVVASQDGKNAKLTVKLAKDLKGINSVEAKDVTVKKGGNLKVENGANVDMGGNQVKNIASGISGKSYRNPKDNNAANIGDVKAIANQAVAPLNKRINDVDKHASAGTASAMAAAGLPQAYLPGHSMVAVGAGTHRGQNAIAVGVSRISDSGHVVIKLNGATNSKGDTSGSVGVGYQW